jgi:hypothetical protein
LPGAIADLLIHLPVQTRQQLLEAEPLATRLELTLAVLHPLLAQLDPKAYREMLQ